MKPVLVAAALFASALAASPSSASEHRSGHAPNYRFPDGSHGYAFTTSGGPTNPGVLVGFNPQPDPPGLPERLVFIGDGLLPAVQTPEARSNRYSFVMSFLGGGSFHLNEPPEPERLGNTSLDFTQLVGDVRHEFHVTLGVSGPGDIASWVAFNPQPDPPGDWFGVQFGFAALGDPRVAFSVTEDGAPLTFALAVPEPASWAMLIAGFGLTGAAVRRRRAALA